MSAAARIDGGTRRGSRWWQAIRPHRRPPLTIEIDIDAARPMFFRYSMCTGETLRRMCWLRSSGAPFASRSGTIGTGA